MAAKNLIEEQIDLILKSRSKFLDEKNKYLLRLKIVELERKILNANGVDIVIADEMAKTRVWDW